MATQNKLFATGVIPDNSQVSKMRRDREYLLSSEVAYELNTYLNFGIFKTFNDVYSHKYDTETGKQIQDNEGPGTPGVRSIFNKSGAVLVGTSTGSVTKDDVISNASEFRIANNVPLMDSPSNRHKIKENSGCTIRELVQASSEGILGRGIYAYSDFMYCKHLGKISNNYLITLRRFPAPVGDFVSSMGVGKTRINEGKNLFSQQIGCLVTWMGTPGNEMSNLLKYSFNMPFKEMSAGWNSLDGADADSQRGVLNSIAAAFDPTYRKQFMTGHGGAQFQPAEKYFGKFFKADGPYNVAQENNWVDQNKVYGPIDRVKKTYMRSEDGIDFEQNFTVVFDYELRSYNGINGRQAMLDLLSNILNVTYTTGDFWGGGYRGAGQHQNSIFSNLQIFKANSGVSGFIDAFAEDYSTITKSLRNSLGNMDFLSLIKTTLNQLGGMIMAGALNKLGRPSKIFANSLLSEQPVGFWHLTVGNPFHPILSVGNLVLKNTTIEHYGPLGLDDFPTGIKVTCELTRGKPRDIREIEKMYMHGNDKIYYSMGPKVIDMYEKSLEYRSSNKNKLPTQSSVNGIEITTGKNSIITSNGEITIEELRSQNINDINSRNKLLKKYNGEEDTYSIQVAAEEQDYGSQPRKTNQK